MTERVLSGRYAVRDIVGTGGMSIVYRAWDNQQRREVAVKVLRPEFTGDAEFVRRFTNEAHAVLQMHHANIVDIYGLGQDGDTRYIVMEFVDGVTLKELIRQEGPIKPRRAVQMAVRILAAVDHAHKNHIVHRDIKPQNILVNADYHVKVTDFGIARATNADQTEADKLPERKNVLGSVHYFSPEQASGQVADEKSDLYSVGVVLYEMLTGVVPFDGDSPEDIAIKHVRESHTPPGLLVPEVSKALDQVIERALSKDSAQRYQTAAEMAADLKRALRMPEGGFVHSAAAADKDGQQTSSKRRAGKRILCAAAILCALALMAAAAVGGSRIWKKLQPVPKAPDVLQMYIEDAVLLIEKAGIHYTIEETQEGETPVGTVIGQEPAPGEPIEEEGRLVLLVSTGAHSCYVPTLIGEQLRPAIETIFDYGLTVGGVEYVVSEEKAGTVIAQSPEPRAYVAEETSVMLTVSGQSAVVPDCMGKTLEEARILLEVEGFNVGRVIEQTGDDAPDTIVSQSITPGVRTFSGETVDLVVSRLDPESAWRCNAEVRFSVPTALTEVRMTLEDGDGERTVYLEELALGSHVASLTLLSRQQGEHMLRVYIGGEIALETYLEFR